MNSTQSKSVNIQYKAIPISLYGIKYFDKILHGKMFIIDNHFHNIYRNYQRLYEIRKKEIEDIIKSNKKIKIKEIALKFKQSQLNNEIDKEKRKYLNRIIKEINYMRKYLMKKEYERKVIYKVVNKGRIFLKQFHNFEKDITKYPFLIYKWQFRILKHKRLKYFKDSSYLNFDDIKNILLREKKI